MSEPVPQVITCVDGRFAVLGDDEFRTDDRELAEYVAKELRLADKEATPKDVANTAKLKEYWAHGEGAAKINWGAPGDFNRCRVNLGKYVTGNTLDGLCANLHHMALGVWPGQENGNHKSKGSGVDRTGLVQSAVDH